MAVITIAGEQLIAQKQQSEEPLEIAEFVLAYVPGVDPSVPPERNQSLPPCNQIRLRMAPTRSAYVNSNEVVYSLILDNTIGNFDFNWLGLVSEEGVLVSANHMVVQSKRKNNELTGEEGNNLTRNFLLKFSGAQAVTNITVASETWQFNYESKLEAMETLLAQLSVGLIKNQKDAVEQCNEGLLWRDANRDFGKSLEQLNMLVKDCERDSVELRLAMNRTHQSSEHKRREMDIVLTTALLKSQQQTVEQAQLLMKLNERIRLMEK
ncbi:phage tail protein [Vibrio alginolyticus]|uniref:phage tail-collar fiber domain-containing protein n=1 Tax=Vibrio alginolyticus TaxID=663 RepID=UPI001A90247A|nr:phage tail protein [Vibrio alginolyticus]MBO0161524.1 phage tail protein [Vibrio alginolyticus]